MRTSLVIGLALIGATISGVASAQEGAKLDCIYAGADMPLKRALAQSMAKGGEDLEDEAYYTQVGDIALGCIATHGISETQSAAYIEYSLSRILREFVLGELSAQNLSPLPIDTALDFRVGGKNPDISAGISEDQFAAVIEAYSETGVDLESLDDQKLELVGTYIGATSKYWVNRAVLTR